MLDTILGIICLALGVVSLLLSYGVVRRTKNAVRHCFLLILIGIGAFISYELFTIFKYEGANLLCLLFIFFIMGGLWKLKSTIRSLSDFGQAFVLVSQDEYEDRMAFLIKGIRNTCYVTLEKPYKKVMDFLDIRGIDTSNLLFIDASGIKTSYDNCISISNNPSEIENALERILKERDISRVIIDNISAVKKIKKFELPKFVQDIASLIKAHEAQGFFIGKIEKLDKQMINDISMLVDKIVRSGEK
jgi:hypothetical protein